MTGRPGEPYCAGVLTLSDKGSRGEREDTSGPLLQEMLQGAGFTVAAYEVIPDQEELIVTTLEQWSDALHLDLIVTTGGTGPAPRDVTPEATEDVIEKLMPGFGELMRQVSLAKVPTAILSRQTAGIRGNALIVNLPGRPRAITECLDAVMPAIPYCIDLIEGPWLETDPAVIAAFRPKK